MSQLNSFGAIFTFAIELEDRIHNYYKALGDAEKAEAAESRKEKLERSRRENVLEITLEPIDGLNEADYSLNLADSSAAGQKAIAQIAAKFYADTAPKINVRQAQRTLERCGKEHAEE
jgi:hypothetical protein